MTMMVVKIGIVSVALTFVLACSRGERSNSSQSSASSASPIIWQWPC